MGLSSFKVSKTEATAFSIQRWSQNWASIFERIDISYFSFPPIVTFQRE